jgi:hypothetical protein
VRVLGGGKGDKGRIQGVWQLRGGSNPRHRRSVQGGGGDGERETGREKEASESPVIALCVIVMKINHVRGEMSKGIFVTYMMYVESVASPPTRNQ